MLCVKVALLKPDTETKINELYLLVFPNHDILQLNITMSDILRVQISHCTHDLLEDDSPHILTHFSAGFVLEVVEHRFLANILHDQHNLALAINGMEKLDDIGMINLREEFDLTVDIFHLLLVEELVLLIDLENDFLPGVFVCGQFNEGVGS